MDIAVTERENHAEIIFLPLNQPWESKTANHMLLPTFELSFGKRLNGVLDDNATTSTRDHNQEHVVL